MHMVVLSPPEMLKHPGMFTLCEMEKAKAKI